ncbi:hypothetical protein GRJ2_000333400 [Grus japonensis]|uniref:Uncharacterized protein n=1 Tax=Grus japonensis TaxID=30415 RepID=A0ABC9W015_GRUJA
MPAGSKMDPPLAKAKPISASVITYLRRKTKELKGSFCNQREEREDVRNSADTKVYPICRRQVWCHVDRPMIKKPKILQVTPGSEQDIDLLALPVSLLIIPCNWKDS